MKDIKKDLKENWWILLIILLSIIITPKLIGNVCSSKIIFGIPCPLCGMTRAGIYFLTFQWKHAWNMNPIIFLVVLWGMIIFIRRYILKKRKDSFLWKSIILLYQIGRASCRERVSPPV